MEPRLRAAAAALLLCLLPFTAANTPVASVAELRAAIQDGAEVIVLTAHLSLSCSEEAAADGTDIGCDSFQLRPETRAIVVRCFTSSPFSSCRS